MSKPIRVTKSKYRKSQLAVEFFGKERHISLREARKFAKDLLDSADEIDGKGGL